MIYACCQSGILMMKRFPWTLLFDNDVIDLILIALLPCFRYFQVIFWPSRYIKGQRYRLTYTKTILKMWYVARSLEPHQSSSFPKRIWYCGWWILIIPQEDIHQTYLPLRLWHRSSVCNRSPGKLAGDLFDGWVEQIESAPISVTTVFVVYGSSR